MTTFHADTFAPRSDQREISPGRWRAARPMGMVGLPGLLQRLREAWRVLRGRADIVVWEQQ